MKTVNEILTDIIAKLNDSAIAGLTGSIYKNKRREGSELEDCVVSIISGNNDKFLRSGKLIIKIFYPDIIIEESNYEDSLRGQALEKMLYDFSETTLNGSSGYSFYASSRETYTDAVEELDQHYAVLRINIYSLN